MQAQARVAIAATLFALAAWPALAQQPVPANIESFYSSAVESMRALRQPQYLTYTMEGQGIGLSIRLKVVHHLVWLELRASPYALQTGPVVWTLRHRTDDYASEIVEEDGRRLVSTRAFFDPTWYGAFRALRDGMLDFQQTDQPVSAYATPTPGPSPDLRTIAIVEVIGTNIYSVEDAGSAYCENGDSGRALHLTARDGSPRHQLSDVVVDLRNLHFCTMRFNVAGGGWRETVEQHFSDVGGYWLQTDGSIEASVRQLGMLLGHGVWSYHLDATQFPASIDPWAFVPPADQ
jgi:hypothetical protein